jgi:tight adherence protein C
MFSSAITGNADLIVASMAAVSVFSASMVVSWPYLARDTLGDRMRQVAEEREAIRTRERSKLQAGKPPLSLRTKPKQVFKDIFDRMNLAKQAEDGAMVQKLRMAGYRGQGPVVTFVAIRLIMPLALFAVTAFYIFAVLQLEQPFIVKLGIAIAAAYLGCYVPALYVKNTITKRQKAIRRAWPDALDLLLICVESGMGIESAFRKVSEEMGPRSPVLAEELSLTTAELSYLPERRKAYENLALRTGLDSVKSVVTSLIQAEKYGTPVGQSLRVLAQESRDMRMSEAEKKAAGLPPKLTVPMILFFMPVLFAVIITPAAIQIANAH